PACRPWLGRSRPPPDRRTTSSPREELARRADPTRRTSAPRKGRAGRPSTGVLSTPLDGAHRGYLEGVRRPAPPPARGIARSPPGRPLFCCPGPALPSRGGVSYDHETRPRRR